MSAAAVQVVERIQQPHGGALLSGGQPGNRGGRSYPSRVRAQARKHLARSLGELAKIAAGQPVEVDVLRGRDRGKPRVLTVEQRAAPRERVAAAVALEHIARAPSLNVDDVRVRLTAQSRVLRERLADQPALLEQLLAELGQVWR